MNIRDELITQMNKT